MADASVHGTRYGVEDVVAVSSGGVGLAWSNGEFTGPQDVLRTVRINAALGEHVDLYGADLVCNDYTPLGALAAMASVRPGRTRITRAPESVLAVLRERGYAHSFIAEEVR